MDFGTTGNAANPLDFHGPHDHGTDGYHLTTDGDGGLSWTAAGGGGGGIAFDGSTADGILTYKDSDEASVESNLTYTYSATSTNPNLIVGSDHGAVGGVNAGVEGQGDNPFQFEEVKEKIIKGLSKHGYQDGKEYIVIKVPNITDVSYGRGVGYSFTEHDLGKEIHEISATKIRKEMRIKGKLK